MGTKTSIIVRTTFEGYHNWPDAPIEVEFLRFPHRHKFFIEAKIPVLHDDRFLEFFIVKRFMDDTIQKLYPEFALKQRSCEMIAKDILEALMKFSGIKRSISVSVFEDNENGAMVEV